MKAHEIMHISRNTNDAIARAEEMDGNVHQDWDDEATIYQFDDGSVLAVSGSDVKAFDGAAECAEEFPGMAEFL